MQVILLERIGKLGQMGDTVTVKDGYARNYLLPQGKALRATEANKQRYDKERSQLETRNLALKKEADGVADAFGRSLLLVHLHQTRSETPLVELVEVEGEGVPQVPKN